MGPLRAGARGFQLSLYALSVLHQAQHGLGRQVAETGTFKQALAQAFFDALHRAEHRGSIGAQPPRGFGQRGTAHQGQQGLQVVGR
jgi:hypothetical protein